MSGIKKALGAFAAATALAAGMLAGTASPASAADNFTFQGLRYGNGNYTLGVLNNTRGATAGTAEWWADPDADGHPGDTLVAKDSLPDGYGIEAHLSTGRVASTVGLSSPVTVQKPGDLTEGNEYEMWVCVVKGDFSKCSFKVTVTA